MKEMVLKTHLDCWYNEFFLSCNVQVVWEVNVHMTYLFIDVFIYLFRYVCILWLGMTEYDFATLSSSEHVTELRWASTEGSIFSLLVVCCALVAVTDTNTYAIEEYLIVSVRVHKITAQVRQWIRWWHLFFQQWFGKPSVCRATLLSWKKMCLFIWEYERLSLEWLTNNLNGDLCCCCHFHWTFTAQFNMEMISRNWSTVLTMFDHVKS
jgi:hypothetical protein